MKSKIARGAKKKLLSDFFGCWSNDKNELEQISKIIANERKKFKTREVKF